MLDIRDQRFLHIRISYQGIILPTYDRACFPFASNARKDFKTVNVKKIQISKHEIMAHRLLVARYFLARVFD
jgi:hypothetical protein